MNTCRRFEKHLAAFAHEELSEKQTARLAAHVAQCERCRSTATAYRDLARGMRNLPKTPVPEHVLQGFSREIMQQIAAPAHRESPRYRERMLALFTPRWRFAVAAAVAAAVLLVLFVWQTPLEKTGAPALKLAEILQTRAWNELYYGMLQKESRAFLLHEPVPAELIKTALTELLEQGSRDKRLRMGLQQAFVAVAGREPLPREIRDSAKILGVINARGYRLASRKRSSAYDPEIFLRQVQSLPHGSEVTLADLMKSND